jgi:hypothetical protein
MSCISVSTNTLYDNEDISQAIYKKQVATFCEKGIFLQTLLNTLFYPSHWYEKFKFDRKLDTLFILEHVNDRPNYDYPPK